MWGIKKNKNYSSKFNNKLYIGKLKGNKALFSGGVTQSGGELITMWDFVSKRIKKENKFAKNCLVLGVAGGTCISSLIKDFPKLKVTGIELDQVMIDIYNEQFRNKIKIELINEDAFKWLNQDNKKYDIIIVDLFIGKFNPTLSRRKIFFKNLIKNLTKNGIVAYNSHFDKKNPNEFERLMEIIDINFNTEIIYDFPLNKMLFLTQRGKISKNLNNKL